MSSAELAKRVVKVNHLTFTMLNLNTNILFTYLFVSLFFTPHPPTPTRPITHTSERQSLFLWIIHLEMIYMKNIKSQL